MITIKTTNFRISIAATLVWAALVCAGIGVHARPKNQAAENACLDAYDVCYNNCKGKADVCYSNCDTVYLHCLRGAGVVTGSVQLRKHPFRPERAVVAPNLSNSTATSGKGPAPTTTPNKRNPTSSKKPSPTPSPKMDNQASSRSGSPTPTPKKDHH